MHTEAQTDWQTEKRHVQADREAEEKKERQKEKRITRRKDMDSEVIKQQVTRAHNIVADRWAGASNPYPHPKPHSLHMHTKKYPKHYFQLDHHSQTNGRADGRTKPLKWKMKVF